MQIFRGCLASHSSQEVIQYRGDVRTLGAIPFMGFTGLQIFIVKQVPLKNHYVYIDFLT